MSYRPSIVNIKSILGPKKALKQNRIYAKTSRTFVHFIPLILTCY